MPALPRAFGFGFGTPRGPAFTGGSALGRAGTPQQRYNIGSPVTAITGVAATDLFTKAAHGFVGGENVVITSLTGGVGLPPSSLGGLCVLFVSSSTLRLATVPGGPPSNFTTDVTAMSLQKVPSGAPVQ
jgi:hypothetical protein